MADDLGKEVMRRADALKGERGTWESHWQEVAEVISPMRADFTTTRTAGSKRMDRVFDGTAGMAAENLAGGLYGLMTSPANEWFALRHPDEDIDADRAVRLWLDRASRIMRNAFAAGGNRFYTHSIDFYADLVAFGTAVFYTEAIPGEASLHFETRHLAECCIAENRRRRIDTVIRRYNLTARQAAQEKAWTGSLSPASRVAAEKSPEQTVEIVHAVLPSDELDGAGDRPFASVYVEAATGTTLSTGGYFELPYQVARWSTRSRSVYGDGPGQLALPDTKMLNAMSKTTIIGAQKAVDPPVLAADEAAIRGIRMQPGQILYGGVDPATGRALYQPFQTGGALGLGIELEERRRQAVRDAFYFSLLLMVQQPNMTATEFLGRQEEKIRLMGPHLGRIQSEFLDSLIDRVFALLWRAGAFPPPPAILARAPGLKVEYVSPLARMQRTSEAAALLRAAEALAPIAALDPTVWDNVDTDGYARGILEGFGVPARFQRDPADVAAMRQQRQQQQAAAAMAELAPPVAAGAKDAMVAAETMQRIAGGGRAAAGARR